MSDDVFELELPGVYLDACIEDAVPAVVGQTPTLINLDPEADETRVLKSTNVRLELATIDATGMIDLAATQVFIDDVLAFAGGVVQTGFTGGYFSPQADVLRIELDPDTDFDSEALVRVRVVSNATGDTSILDTTYSFTIEDTTPPELLRAQAVELQRVRVRFTENVLQVGAGVTSALDAADYQIARLGDYLTPLVSVNVVAVESVDGSTVDLLTDIALTPGGYYRLSASGLQDVNGNAIDDATVDFFGWTPPVPAGREFDLYRKLPLINRQEDETEDLFRFVACIQEVVGLLLYDIDRFIDIIDPDTAPEAFVDAMLEDLGNPFAFDLSLTDKRRLAQTLVDIYRLKGTGIGIISVIRFFMGLEVTIDAFNLSTGSWILGDSELGFDTVLATDDEGLLYSFQVTVVEVLTTAQRKSLVDIVDYMKPAHTHFVRLIEPTVPEVLDHLELGLSELGENWQLH